MAIVLSRDEALEGPEDVLRLESFEGASCDVVAGANVVPHADQHDCVQRSVGLAVSAAVEPVAVCAPGLRPETGTKWLLAGQPSVAGPLATRTGSRIRWIRRRHRVPRGSSVVVGGAPGRGWLAAMLTVVLAEVGGVEG